jgi:hypothetical protein
VSSFHQPRPHHNLTLNPHLAHCPHCLSIFGICFAAPARLATYMPSLLIAYRPCHLLLCTVLRTSKEVDEAGGHQCWLLSSCARKQHRGLSPRRLPFCACAALHTPHPRTTSPLRLPHFASPLSSTPRQLSSTIRRRSPSPVMSPPQTAAFAGSAASHAQPHTMRAPDAPAAPGADGRSNATSRMSESGHTPSSWRNCASSTVCRLLRSRVFISSSRSTHRARPQG